MANFELFEKRRTPPAKSPFVTILKNGVISMNSFAYDELMGRPAYIEFLYDGEDRIVGLRGHKLETQFSYPVRELKSAVGGTFSVSAKAFLLYYGIQTDSSIRREATMQGDVLCIDLKDEGVDVTFGRTKNEE